MAHGVGCAVWGAAQNPEFSGAELGLTLVRGLNAPRRAQRGDGSGEDVMPGPLDAQQEPVDPPLCGQWDVTKNGVPTE